MELRIDKQDLLQRLIDDKIKNLWVTYHDCNGRACAKTVPKSKFKSAVEDYVVFARANLNLASTAIIPPMASGRRRPATFWLYPIRTPIGICPIAKTQLSSSAI